VPPDMAKLPAGCKFHPRCRFRIDRCFTEEPRLEEVDVGQLARCWVLMKNVQNPEASQ
jgi:oligopeptide/dipeptide ABC transporter ATP-binding protein